jgi:hypothetical protein
MTKGWQSEARHLYIRWANRKFCFFNIFFIKIISSSKKSKVESRKNIW